MTAASRIAIQYLGVLFTALLCVACAGGTSGTGGTSLQGRVLSESGAGVAAAHVVLQSISESIELITDAEGRFETHIDPHLEYTVAVSFAQFSAVSSLVPPPVAPGDIVQAALTARGNTELEVVVETARPTPTPTVTAAQSPSSTPTVSPAATATPVPTATPAPTALPQPPAFPSVIRLSDVQGSDYAQDGFLDALDIDSFVNLTERPGAAFLTTYKLVYRFNVLDSAGRLVQAAIVALDALEEESSYEVLLGVALRNPLTGQWVNPTTLIYGIGFSVRFSRADGHALPASGFANAPISQLNFSLAGASVQFTANLSQTTFQP